MKKLLLIAFFGIIAISNAQEKDSKANKLDNKIGKGLFSLFQDLVKPSISPVVQLISNIKEVKDNVTDKYDSKTSSDINTFNNFNKISKSKKGVPILNNPNIPPEDLVVFKKLIEDIK